MILGQLRLCVVGDWLEFALLAISDAGGKHCVLETTDLAFDSIYV